MPGVADVYQGTELMTLTLVDPDNRRPVQYDDRPSASPASTVSRPSTSTTKLLVVSRALRHATGPPLNGSSGLQNNLCRVAGPEGVLAFTGDDSGAHVLVAVPIKGRTSSTPATSTCPRATGNPAVPRTGCPSRSG